MIFKYLVLSILTVWLVTASDPFFGIMLTTETYIPDTKPTVREHNWMKTTAFDKYLHDDDERVSDTFKLTPYYYPTVQFWFLIYTQFESTQVLVHDKNNLSIIYKILDFSSFRENQMNRNIHYVLQQKLTKEKVKAIKQTLAHLGKDPFSLKPEAKNMYRLLKNAGAQIPIKKLDRSAFFNQLRDNIRSQTGQKDFIREGVIRSLPYQGFLGNYFKERELPKELLAVPFLESSFNPRAHSKVNALGIWQFMPLIASYYMPKRSVIDYRSNIGVASISAAFLMQENFKIMKSWDLAVTAYNSGTKHLLKTKRQMASSDIDLEDIIKGSDSDHFGFASKNFYSEFLALTYSLAYREELFEGIHSHDRPDVNQDLRFFMLKCSLRLDKNLDKDALDDVEFHNQQFKDLTKTHPRASIVTTKGQLPSSKFLELNFKQILNKKPKDWESLLKNQSCSTR
jgi:membrane-bound lytic murein transglycosylase D